MGFYFIMIALLLPTHCGFFFVLGYRVSFLVGSSDFFVVNAGCSAVSCDSGVFVRRGELTSFYSAILPAKALFFLDCSLLSLHPLLSLINNCLNLLFGTQGRSWKLKPIPYKQETGDTKRLLCSGAPTVSCSVSGVSKKMGD